VEQLNSVIPALEGAVTGIEAELQAAQAAAAAQAASAAASPPPAAPSTVAPSSPSMPSASVSEEPTLEILKLSDLAEITYESGADSTYSRINSDRAVLIDIIKSQEANTVDVSEDTIAAVDEINDALPDGIELTLTYDAAIQINNSIRDMVQEGLLGAFFAFMVILLFLRNWRSTLISAISIPLSVI
jgi:multidrug efflux pump subunit AcrB